MSQEITYLSLFFTMLLLIIPVYISINFNLKIAKKSIMAALRMVIQLFLIGIFLKYLFKLNSIPLNLLWMFVMIVVASYTITESSSLKIKKFIIPILISITGSTFFMMFYFNKIILNLNNIFETQYFIPIGGMLLGNSLRGNIIGVSSFFKNILKNEKSYLYSLSLGASKKEALLPFIRESILSSINPTLASMATVGIISLPGMMTGQVLGGADPMVAIKYQIAIMIAIYVSSIMSIVCVIYISYRSCFNDYGLFKKEIMEIK
jgi:putative ABC transport system permease protein